MKPPIDCKDDELEQNLREHQFLVIGRLIPEIVHEINNPMQAIRGAATLALEEIDNPDSVANYLRLIHRESDRILTLTAFLRKLYRREGTKTRILDLVSIIDQSLLILKDDLNQKGLRLHFSHVQESTYISANEFDLYLVLIELILNINQTLYNLKLEDYSLDIQMSPSSVNLEFAFNCPVQINEKNTIEDELQSSNVIDLSFAYYLLQAQNIKILSTTGERSVLILEFLSAGENTHRSGVDGIQ